MMITVTTMIMMVTGSTGPVTDELDATMICATLTGD